MTDPLVPETDAFAAFWGSEAPVDDDNWDEQSAAVLQQAADLLFLVTGLTEPPTDARQARLVGYAIMDMAISFYVADPAEAYSPYSSERIGSYSYNLKQKASQGMTGVAWWDLVVNAIRDGEWTTAYTLAAAGENVFYPSYRAWDRSERLLHAAPLVSTPGEDPTSGADSWVLGSSPEDEWIGDPYAY